MLVLFLNSWGKTYNENYVFDCLKVKFLHIASSLVTNYNNKNQKYAIISSLFEHKENPGRVRQFN